MYNIQKTRLKLDFKDPVLLNKMLLVTAYYPVKTKKHSVEEYYEMMNIFFECVTCPVMFFCSSETYENLKPIANRNVMFVQREFSSFEMMSEPWKSRWETWHEIDPEKDIHSPELYSIWAAKQEFVREAIKLIDTDIYVWCDAGCFRSKRPGGFGYTANYTSPGKITCLDATPLSNYQPMIGGGVLAGDREAWTTFSQNYLKELENNIHGKDQIVFRRVLNDTNAIIISPTHQYGNPWFYLTSLFSVVRNPKDVTVHLMGGLGNQMFQLAFLMYVRQITGNRIFLDCLESSNSHSSEKYFDTIFSKWKPYAGYRPYTVVTENPKLAHENWQKRIQEISGTIKVCGYFQRFEYVNYVTREFINSLTFNESILQKYPDISTKFFLHIRGGDYLSDPFHFVDLKNYYIEVMNKHRREQFVIFTNDIPYAKSLFPDIPIIEESEVDTLLLMSQAKGCICANSSFSWWGAYLNPDRPIYFPSKWFNDPSMDTSGLYFNGSHIQYIPEKGFLPTLMLPPLFPDHVTPKSSVPRDFRKQGVSLNFLNRN